MAVHPVFEKVVIPVIAGFSDPLSVMITSNPLAVTDLVPEISRTDLDTFTLAKGSYFPRPIPILGGNLTLFFNLFISLPHSHLASFGILFASIIFILSN